MKLLPKLKLSPRLARIAYRFVDLDAESSSIDGRVIEYSFVISRLAAAQKGKVLDVGCTDSGNMATLMLASLGWEVYGIDNRDWKFEHANFQFTQGDIRNTPFSDEFFDYVYAISTLEHIGLKGM
jgi:ubiquinone/menaquinone biosynthesis C-methylase UbiE